MNISGSLQSTYLWIRGIGCYCPIPLFISAFLFSTMVQSSGIYTTRLAFAIKGFDLDAGAATISDIPGNANGTDIWMAYNALRLPGSLVMVNATDGVELIFVFGVFFDGVTVDSLADLTFSAKPVDASFSTADTVVMRTDTGAVFKLGNASDSDTGVTFSNAAL